MLVIVRGSMNLVVSTRELPAEEVLEKLATNPIAPSVGECIHNQLDHSASTIPFVKPTNLVWGICPVTFRVVILNV